MMIKSEINKVSVVYNVAVVVVVVVVVVAIRIIIKGKDLPNRR